MYKLIDYVFGYKFHPQDLSLDQTDALCDSNGNVYSETVVALENMPNLRAIWVEHSGRTSTCDLSQLNNPNLHMVDYSSNQLTTISPEHLVGVELDYFDLNDNPLTALPNPCVPDLSIELYGVTDLTCDCSLRYLMYQSTGSKSYTPCIEPDELADVPLKDLTPDDFVCEPGKCLFS